MQVQPVDLLVSTNSNGAAQANGNPASELTQSGRQPAVQLNASLEAEYYSDEKIAIEYTSKDGDKVSLSMESVQYQKAMIAVQADGSPEDMQKMVDFIKDEYKNMKDELVKSFIKSTGGTVDDTAQTTGANATDSLKVPDYWNAENTSQRIVDFATSFFGAFKGSGADFLNTIKDAIDKGFKEAVGSLGDLPDPIKKLVNDTHDLVMRKLDSWAQENGLTPTASSGDNAASDQTETAAA